MRIAFLSLVASAVLLGQPPQLEKTISLPGVEGRIDHFSVDVPGKRLFMAALGNNTVEVIDPFTGQVLHTIRGLQEPQGVYYWPEGKRLYVANGASGKVQVFDGDSFARIREYVLNSDPDNIRFDPKQKEVFVGYGSGALGVISAKLGSRVGDTILDAHPESFQLELNGPRIFVNVPNASNVTVIDRRTRSITAKWPIQGAAQNFPMALDEAGHRLFVGCRKPPKLVVFDTQTGKQLSAIDITGDTDDLFYDSDLRRIYISGGAGSLTIVNADNYAGAETVPTAAGARTSLFVPEFKRLYVAVPHRGKQPAALLVFSLER